MERGTLIIYLVLILGLGLLLPVVSGENCPVNPDCYCSASIVSCYPKCGPSVPKLAASSKQFSEVKINGNMDTNQILPGTFRNVSTTRVYIQYTRIKDIHCDAFKGIGRSLKYVHLAYNYLESVPSCSLQHVKGIKELHLTKNHISNITSDSFRNAPDLQTLYLDQNEIETIEMDLFNNLGKVTYLNMMTNKISFLNGSVFVGLKSLETLSLCRNRIKWLHPKSFDGLESLIQLELDVNELTSFDGSIFEHLINMKDLNLGNNLISYLPEKIFAKSVKLTRLHLEDNRLVSLPDNIFQTTPLLITLYIQRNNLSAVRGKVFSSTPNLQTLDMSGNLLTIVTGVVFKDCNQLRELTMKNNGIQHLQPGSFKNLASLSVLDLSGNYLTEINAGVFDNSTSLNSLNLAANRISFIENGSLESQQKSLGTLSLRSNELTYEIWVTLTPILTKLNNLTDLDLSHNPIGDLPPAVIDSLKKITDLNLRNCSLTYFPFDKTSYDRLDISVNNLNSNHVALSDKNLQKESDVSTINLITSLNVSDNNLQSVSFVIVSPGLHDISHPDNPSIDAQRNEIKNAEIVLNVAIFRIDRIHLSNNLISTSLGLKTKELDFFGMRIESIDLSYNKLDNVTSYPIRYISTTHVAPVLYYGILVTVLNLSHNNISFVSPEAFLGMIRYLDLSHNRIQVFGRLLPVNTTSSNFNTQYVDLSGNLIHRITPNLFSGYENIIENINLAQNFLTEIQNLRIVLEESGRFFKVELSDNPLVCDCESFWLRQESVWSKLDSVRCDTPDNTKGYMSLCYPLENCSVNQTFNISASILDLCKNDTHMGIINLQLTTIETVATSVRVNVTWTRYGPEQITGYKLEITPSLTAEKMMTSLVHPAAVNYILSGLQIEMTYNVCISAQREQVTVTAVMCKSLQVEATDDNIIISKSILIGISLALLICVLCIVLMLFCYIIRHKQSRCNYQKDSISKQPTSGRFERTQQSLADNNLNPAATPISQSNSCNTQNSGSYLTVYGQSSNLVNLSGMYLHPVNLTDEVDNSNIYETVQNGANVTD